MESEKNDPISDKEMIFYLKERVGYLEDLIDQVGQLLVYRFDASLKEAFLLPSQIHSYQELGEQWDEENFCDE